MHHPGCRLYVPRDKERKRKRRGRDRGLTKERRSRAEEGRGGSEAEKRGRFLGEVSLGYSISPRVSTNTVPHTTSGSVQQTKTSPSTSDERATLARLVCETKFYITLSFVKETYIAFGKNWPTKIEQEGGHYISRRKRFRLISVNSRYSSTIANDP